MGIVKKTVSLPQSLYREVERIESSKNFSKVVQRALKEYLEKRKREKILSFAGSLRDWEVEDGREFVEKLREEEIEAERERESSWDT
ncbi:hypothetical protein SAMN06269117_1172 [Balnearium lithotrophicum]|uniref:Uncharacterized protein n=1 Tax=Balnearium lithotrophicum TaxID=223788 RepID=A0A521D3A4_9BACT|nr:hypothetical protein [Balnearium lithotrophicum]SMO66149.1 hypothetical protein SAMN06269117_1172 [Balnearium lithotrophicum]